MMMITTTTTTNDDAATTAAVAFAKANTTMLSYSNEYWKIIF